MISFTLLCLSVGTRQGMQLRLSFYVINNVFLGFQVTSFRCSIPTTLLCLTLSVFHPTQTIRNTLELCLRRHWVHFSHVVLLYFMLYSELDFKSSGSLWSISKHDVNLQTNWTKQWKHQTSQLDYAIFLIADHLPWLVQTIWHILVAWWTEWPWWPCMNRNSSKCLYLIAFLQSSCNLSFHPGARDHGPMRASS